MPVEQRSTSSLVRAVVVGVVAVVLGVALAVALVVLAGRGDDVVEVRLGDETFNRADAAELAAEIRERGPVLFPDVSGGGQERPLWVNHFGDDPEQGWVAFEAAPPGAPEGCFLAWDLAREVFANPGCVEGEYPPDGEGLVSYPVEVDEEGRIDIDLNPGDDDEERGATTTSSIPVTGRDE